MWIWILILGQILTLSEPDLNIEGLNIQTDQNHWQLFLKSIRWQQYQIHNIHLDCADFVPPDCSQFNIQAEWPEFGLIKAKGHFKNQIFHLIWPYRQGQLKLTGQIDGPIRAQIQNWPLSSLFFLLPAGWQIKGRLSSLWQFESGRFHGQGRVKSLSYSDPDGLQVAEEADFNYQLDYPPGHLRLKINRGQWYSDPWFIPIESPAYLDLQWNNQQKIIFLLRLFDQVVQGQLNDVQPDQIRSMRLDLEGQNIKPLFDYLIQPLLIETVLAELQIKGQLKAHIEIEQGRLSRIDLRLRHLTVEHPLFQWQQMDAEIHWLAQAKADRSYIQWKQAQIYGIKLEPARILFNSQGQSIDFLPFQIGLLGGRLKVDHLVLHFGNPFNWRAQARLKQLKLAQLAESLDWPSLSGQVDADLPNISYQNQTLHLNAPLRLNLFSGQVQIEKLSWQDPLGVAPVLECQIKINGLDLKSMTQVFDFGRIEGSLNGQIDHLQLIAWQLNRFDAQLYTPKQDTRPHRISRKAVDQLTDLSQGRSLNLSDTILSFFNHFDYDQIVINIRLQGDQAELSGLPRKKGGFYIVKGKRLPRIDIIGVNHQIAWKELIARLKKTQFDQMRIE